MSARRGVVALGAVALSGIAGCAQAGTCAEGGAICISDAYVVRPAGDAPTAFYATITNRGDAGDTLVALIAPGYGLAMLHTTRDGAMERPSSVPIATREVLRLRPGALHGMLEHPHRSLAAVDSAVVDLRFARAGTIRVTARAIAYADVDRLVPP